MFHTSCHSPSPNLKSSLIFWCFHSSISIWRYEVGSLHQTCNWNQETIRPVCSTQALYLLTKFRRHLHDFCNYLSLHRNFYPNILLYRVQSCSILPPLSFIYVQLLYLILLNILCKKNVCLFFIALQDFDCHSLTVQFFLFIQKSSRKG